MAPKIKMDRQFLILIYKLESWPHSICFSKGNKTTLTAEIKTIKKLETFSVKEIFPERGNIPSNRNPITHNSNDEHTGNVGKH